MAMTEVLGQMVSLLIQKDPAPVAFGELLDLILIVEFGVLLIADLC